MQKDSNFFLEEEEGIDFQKWFFKILENWYLFVVFIIIALLLAFVFNYVTTDQYKLVARVLIKESNNPLDKSDLIRVSLSSDPYRLENEIGIINSISVRQQTLKELDFFTDYFTDDSWKNIELYRTSPFIVLPDSNSLHPINVLVQLNYINDSLVVLEIKSDELALYNYTTWKVEKWLYNVDITDTVVLGKPFMNSPFNFTIHPVIGNITHGYKDKSYSFVFRDIIGLVNAYSAVEVDISSGSSIMEISLKHSNPQKASIYLNTLVQNYLQKGIERENVMAKRTINFIDEQLDVLIDSLQSSEQKLQDFRSEQRLVNIDIQTQQAYARQGELESRMAELTMRKRYLEYLDESLKANTIEMEELIAPGTLGINDGVLNSMVMELLEFYNERTELTLNSRRNNPYITSLDSRIESSKRNLAETVANILGTTVISIDEVKVQLKEIGERLGRLPKDQRELLGFERKFQLNDELYTYLLTHRSDMQIKLASNIPANEILDEADPRIAYKVYPNKKLNYILALLLGAFIPFLIIYIGSLLNNKVESQDDIKGITQLPVLGTIFKSDVEGLPAVTIAPTSILAESFRMLRANLQFVLGTDENAVITVSSAMKGEGKSYNSINLAAVYSSYGKKVCLIDLDLRRPKLADYIGVSNDKGISNYLSGQVTEKEIVQSPFEGMFDLITSGPIPPNPSEMVSSKKLIDLIEKIRGEYDIILLDTPPIGMVSDAMVISRLTQYFLLVIRHKVTHQKLLSNVLEEMQRNKIGGLNLIYNDVPAGKKGYYRYGSRYGYYYTREKKGMFGKKKST